MPQSREIIDCASSGIIASLRFTLSNGFHSIHQLNNYSNFANYHIHQQHTHVALTFTRFSIGKCVLRHALLWFCQYHSYDTANHLISKWCAPGNFNLLTDFSFSISFAFSSFGRFASVPFSCFYLFNPVIGADSHDDWHESAHRTLPITWHFPIESSSNNLHFSISEIALWWNEAIRFCTGLLVPHCTYLSYTKHVPMLFYSSERVRTN